MPEVRSIKGLEVRHDYKLGALRLREAPEKRAQAVRGTRHTMLLRKAVSMDGDYHLVINSSGREKRGPCTRVYTYACRRRSTARYAKRLCLVDPSVVMGDGDCDGGDDDAGGAVIQPILQIQNKKFDNKNQKKE